MNDVYFGAKLLQGAMNASMGRPDAEYLLTALTYWAPSNAFARTDTRETLTSSAQVNAAIYPWDKLTSGNTCNYFCVFGFSDTDECQTGAHDCHADAQCINLNGAYTCQCKAGYEGDGKTCVGKLIPCDGGSNDTWPYDHMTSAHLLN